MWAVPRGGLKDLLHAFCKDQPPIGRCSVYAEEAGARRLC